MPTEHKVSMFAVLRDGEIYLIRPSLADARNDRRSLDMDGESKHEWTISAVQVVLPPGVSSEPREAMNHDQGCPCCAAVQVTVDKLYAEVERLRAVHECPKCRAASDAERDAIGRAASLARALQSIKTICAGDRAPNWIEDGWAVTQSRGRILDLCDVALGHQQESKA